MKKMITLLLALVMVLSLLPVSAMAISKLPAKPALSPDFIANPPEKLPTEIKDKIIEEDLKDNVTKAPFAEKKPVYHHPGNEHEYGYASNAKYHWMECPCGCQINMEPHVDPKNASDDYCYCGYRFSSNADLVTLWVDGCPVIKNFNKNTTEYDLKAYTYKDVKQIKVSTRTFDSQATVELPEDLTLKEGENKFEVKVIAENQKDTKIYTLNITKEAAK